MSCGTDSKSKRTGRSAVSKNVTHIIKTAGWEIPGTPTVRNGNDGVSISIPVRIQGGPNGDCDYMIYYDGTDRGFAESVQTMSRNFNVNAYAKDMAAETFKGENPKDMSAWLAEGKLIKDALINLAKVSDTEITDGEDL